MAQEPEDESPTAETQPFPTGRPACDACKSRKTKCDRDDPCSACVTLKLTCRFTRPRGEKRQRVLLSNKYEESLEGINQRLGELADTLQSITGASGHRLPSDLPPRDAYPPYLQAPRSREDSSFASAYCEGFQGDSSFHAHAREAERLIQSIRSGVYTGPSAVEVLTTPMGLHAESNGDGDDVVSQDSTMADYPQLGERPLPPMEPVWRILRLANRIPQRVFTDLPVFDVDQLTEICQTIYFGAKTFSVYDWVIANVGLLYLFDDLEEEYYAEVGVTGTSSEEIIVLLESNCMGAVDSLRLSIVASIATCQAISLLASFCMRQGHISVSWRMLTTAARQLLDLGLHRLPPDSSSRRSSLFWHVYAMEKFVAFTLGRTPTIHHYDVTTARPSLLGRSPVHSSGVGLAFVDFAYLAGQIHLQLFSASALQAPLRTRVGNANGLIVQLWDNLSNLQVTYPNDPTSISAAEALVIVAYSYLTIVYRTIGPQESTDDSDAFRDESVNTARRSLESFVALGSRVSGRSERKWSRFLNLLLTFSPFVPFMVLACNMITPRPQRHLPLLRAVLHLLQMNVTTSAIARETWMTCNNVLRLVEGEILGETSVIIPNADPHM